MRLTSAQKRLLIHVALEGPRHFRGHHNEVHHGAQIAACRRMVPLGLLEEFGPHVFVSTPSGTSLAEMILRLGL